MRLGKWNFQQFFTQNFLHIALCYRFCNILANRTMGHPDESFKSVEVAHKMVFG